MPDRRTRCCWLTLTSLLLATAVPAWAADALSPENANVVLRLDAAVPGRGDRLVDLEIELPIRGGDWPKSSWATAFGFRHSEHVARLRKHTRDGEALVLEFDLDFRPDLWDGGAKGSYTIRLTPVEGGRLTGAYEGSFTAGEKMAPLKGKAGGRFAAPWPAPVADYTPPAPAEHPRLLIDPPGVAALKKRISTSPEAKAMWERFVQFLGVDVAEAEGGNDAKFASWPAVSHAFAWRVTGEKEHADKARGILEATVLKHYGGGQDIHHAARLIGLTLAYDFACDAWDAEFRAKCVANLQRRVADVSAGAVGGKPMGGHNPSRWSNHNGIRAGAAGLGALVLVGEKGADGKPIEGMGALADRMAREVRDYLRYGIADSGPSIEGQHYKAMTAYRGLTQFLRAYPVATGQRINPSPLGDFFVVHHFMGAKPGQLFKAAREYDGIGEALDCDGRNVRDIVWTMAWPLVPERFAPAVKYLFQRTVGLEGDRTFGINHGISGVMLLCNYPFEAQPKPPADVFPWAAPDVRQGHFVVRTGWDDARVAGDAPLAGDLVLTLNMKSGTRGSCHYERSGVNGEIVLHGFGRTWLAGPWLPMAPRKPRAGNPHIGAEVIASERLADRVIRIELRLDRAYYGEAGRGDPRAVMQRYFADGVAYVPLLGDFLDFGIRGRRQIIVDASGTSGAPLLVAVLDQMRVEGDDAGEHRFRSRLPIPDDAGEMHVEGNRFRVGKPSGPSLAGVVANVGKLDAADASAESDGALLTVFTLQNAKPPQVTVKGEGLDAEVRAGARTVRVSNGKLVIE